MTTFHVVVFQVDGLHYIRREEADNSGEVLMHMLANAPAAQAIAVFNSEYILVEEYRSDRLSRDDKVDKVQPGGV